jgi:protein O-mannosyl-transferase
MERGRPAGALLAAAASAAVFSRVLGYPFLNWDDQDVFLRNEALRAPGLVEWAFTTRYMEHYQPLSWIAWAAGGPTPAAAHALNVVLHAACAACVYLLMWAGVKASDRADVTGRREIAAITATLFWALHPLRVEVVAWPSAMPYALALLFALLATLAWLGGRFWTAIGLFAMSLLARPIALGLPLVFLALGPAFAKAPARKPALVGLLLAMAFALAESSARLTASLAEFGVGPRLTLAATAPFLYLWRTIVPINLTPLDPLALTPRTDPLLIVLGVAGIVLISVAAWRWRREQPALALSWLAYLALLAPAMGLVPSGLQATADRYTYLAAVPVSFAIAAGIAGLARASIAVVATAGAAAVAVLAVLTWGQSGYWRDSVTLWTRAVEIDPRNDVALYNLAAALDEAGRSDEALTRYDQVLAVVPAHADAQRNRDRLRARTLEAEANRLAGAGNLEAAVPRYAEAVRLDDRRAHSHAALGMALTQLGRLGEARPHLQAALEQGITGAPIFNALAYGLMQSGDREGARAVLRRAQRAHPKDPDIARNLALLSQR